MNPELLARAYQLRAQASIIAEGPGVSFIPKGDREYESKDPTTGAGGDTFSLFARRLAKCRSDQDLVGFIKALEDELNAIKRYQGKGPETASQFRFRLIDQYEGKNYRVVAHAEKVSVSYVRKIRQEAGRDTLMGRKLAA